MSRGRQVIRQWYILRALEESRRGLSVRELLGLVEDGVTERTLYRDIEQLRAVGFQIEDVDGQYQLGTDGPSTHAAPITETEQLALILSEGLLAPLGETWIGQPLRELRRRLLATMTPVRREYVDDLKQTIVTSHTGGGSYGAHQAVMATVQDAMIKEQVVRVVYAKPNEPVMERELEPYASWYRGGRLYIVAYCRTRMAMRTFAVNRIKEAELLDITFERSESFDAQAFTQKGFGVFHGPGYDFVVDFAPTVAHLPSEYSYHPTQSARLLESGWVRLSFTSSGLPEVTAWVCSFGAKMRPVAPPELVGACRELHSEALEVIS